MRKIIFTLIFLMSWLGLSAQVTHRTLTPKPKPETDIIQVKSQRCGEVDYNEMDYKSNYVNIGYQRLVMKPEGGQDLTSNLGVLASIGKTFILNSQPSVFNYGLDVVWADLNYVNYKLEYHYDGMTKKETYHQMEIGMQGGMAVILKPSQNFSARLYARYAPCFAAMYVDKDFYGSYGDFIVAGLSFNLGSSFGIGADYRYGSCKYKKMGGNDAEGLDVPAESLPSTDYLGFRAYLVYQF